MFSLLSSVFTFFLGIVVTIILEKPIKQFVHKLTVMIKKSLGIYKPSKEKRDIYYTIGNWSTAWVIVEGSTASKYSVDRVEVFLDTDKLTCTDTEINRRMGELSNKVKEEKTRGTSRLHDGTTAALVKIQTEQRGAFEEPVMKIHLQLSNYFMFASNVNRLDERYHENGHETTLREKYIKGVAYRSPVPHLASVFAIQMALITVDGYFLVSKRATENIIGYPGYLAPALNESIHPIKDFDNRQNELSLFKTVKRAASDELNIDVYENETVFFTLGVDVKEYMYTLTGLINSSLTSDYVFEKLSRGAKEGFEADKYFLLGPTVEDCARTMSELSMNHKWAPYGIVCLTQAMVYKFGVGSVEKALKKYKRHDKEPSYAMFL